MSWPSASSSSPDRSSRSGSQVGHFGQIGFAIQVFDRSEIGVIVQVRRRTEIRVYFQISRFRQVHVTFQVSESGESVLAI